MRTIRELVIIVRDNLDLMKDTTVATGLCSVISTIVYKNIITIIEYNKLLNYTFI